MKLEQQVCSLELAKRLKELGVKQESLWHHCWYPEDELDCLSIRASIPRWATDGASAFTVAELGEMLPPVLNQDGTDAWLHIEKLYLDGWRVCYCDDDEPDFEPLEATTEADARAKTLVYLLENKLLSVRA